MHELTRAEARRVAVRGQMLTAERPSDLLATLRRLALVQIDPTAAVAPSADLVLWSRLGSAYHPEMLRDALSVRIVVELSGVLRPAEDVVLFGAEMATWPGDERLGPLKSWQRDNADWVEANDGCRRDLLTRLADGGPLSTRELPDSCAVPWRSSGWTEGKNVARLLEFMLARGEVAIAGRRRQDRLWDLAERVYPDEEPLPLEEARHERARRRLSAQGLCRAGSQAQLIEQVDLADVGEEAVVEGVRGRWRVDPSLLDAAAPPFEPRTAVLSPLDQLIHDRTRMAELFEFDYQLEMFKPVATRRFGYWAMPVLHGDRLVAKVDATADRRAGVLRVDAIHADDGYDDAAATGLDAELADLADWLGLDPAR